MESSSAYDAVLVLGSGIREGGSLPESSMAMVKKAVELVKSGCASYVIFSGRWSYALPHTPPVTEAKAMANYASSLGLPKEAILTEDESFTTVSNTCLVKKNILEKRNWKRIILISLYPQDKRAEYNLKRVLGRGYQSKTILADFQYPPEKLAALIETEKIKIREARAFHKGIKAGDHEKIFILSTKDLKENYIPRLRK